jgi:leader peptidase (prepilin peptidase) / N-methyltransferase
VWDGIEIGIWFLGLLLGVLINLSIYGLAYFPRAISPWQAREPGAGRLSWAARLPVLGWWFRRSESVVWGRGFWVRPMVIEAATPWLLVWLYRYLMAGNTLPLGVPIAAALAELPSGGLWTHGIAVGILLVLLTIATFIDIDERTIPDWITVPGTWVGVIGAALLPGWHLWELTQTGYPAFTRGVTPLHAHSPQEWVMDWNQVGPWGRGLWLGLFIWFVWCCSLGNLRWITRRGFSKALIYAWVGFVRSPNLSVVLGMFGVGSCLIIAGYVGLPSGRWQALLSSLMGIGLGGCLVWSFRIVAGGVLGQEALGFGDVTLMAMVGAFFGWQVVLISFFLAPLFGIALVLIYWVITRDSAVPFGPFLAAATSYVILDWPRVWDAVSLAFPPVRIYLVFLVVLLLLLGSLLWVVRLFKLRVS